MLTVHIYNHRQKFFPRGDFPPLPCFNVDFLTVNLYALFIAGNPTLNWGRGKIQTMA